MRTIMREKARLGRRVFRLRMVQVSQDLSDPMELQSKGDTLEEPMRGRSDWVFTLLPCLAVAWGLPKRLILAQKLKHPEGLTARGYQLNTFFEADLLNPLLERDLSAVPCYPEIFLIFPSRDWLTTGQVTLCRGFLPWVDFGTR